jgi:hypothetical protein
MPVPYVIGNPYIDADFSYLLSLLNSSSNVTQLPAAAALAYDNLQNTSTAMCGFSFSRSVNTLSPSSVVAQFALGVPWVLSANLAYPPSTGYVTGAPSSPVTFALQQNGSQIGTMAFSGNTATFTLVATQIKLKGADLLTVVGPSNYSTMSGVLSFTILGYRFLSTYG